MAEQPYLQDADFVLWNGDVRDVLRDLEPGSVDCVITSPPYWGLRDYGTGLWDGGDADCDHLAPLGGGFRASTLTHGPGQPLTVEETEQVVRNRQKQYGAVCGRCGARRVDNQIGLEPTPDAYVETIVGVFREVRRVLADHGTCWINLGDSYASGGTGWRPGNPDKNGGNSNRDGVPVPPGLKPKDLCMIPARVALALQTDGWYLRSDIIWAKPNPMPESVTDRPTNAHEHVFLLTKQPRYWFDAEAVREPPSASTFERWGDRAYIKAGQPERRRWEASPTDGRSSDARGEGNCGIPPGGRNIRNVWEIATQPYAEAHFATYPQELVRRCLLAGCPEWVCRVCGKPRERIVERTSPDLSQFAHRAGVQKYDAAGRNDKDSSAGRISGQEWSRLSSIETLGWSDCGHGDYRPGVVLDPFLGSGTTAYVARRHARHTIGIELSAEYCELIARRTQQLSLEVAGSVDAEGADARDSENPAPRSTTPQLPLEHDGYGTPATPLVRAGKNERTGDRRKAGFNERWKQ